MTFFYRLCFIVFKSFCILYPSGLEQKQINKKKTNKQNFLRRFNEKNLMKGLFTEVVDKV